MQSGEAGQHSSADNVQRYKYNRSGRRWKKGFRELYSCLNEVLQIEFEEVKKTPDLQPSCRSFPRPREDAHCLNRAMLLVSRGWSSPYIWMACGWDHVFSKWRSGLWYRGKKSSAEKLAGKELFWENGLVGEGRAVVLLHPRRLSARKRASGTKEKALEIFFSHREFVQYMGYKTAKICAGLWRP